MNILLVSVGIEFPLATYCLAAQVGASSSTRDAHVKLINLDWEKLSSYDLKNAETWRYISVINEEQPALIGFSVYIWNHIAIRELIAITRRLFSRSWIVGGGPELITRDAAELWVGGEMKTIAVRGEGEQTFVELVDRFAQGGGPQGIAGVTWFDGSTVRHEVDRIPARDLSMYASPFLDGWVPKYIFENEDSEPVSAPYVRALLETYRGCYMACSYCQWGNGTKNRFSFPEERIRKEISWLLSQRITSLFIIDAMFGYKKRIAESLLEHIISEKQHYKAHTKIALYHNQDFYDPHLIDLYREAGAYVEVDLQSTNYEVLKKIGRERWYIDSFDRHRKAFKRQKVLTTGSADLIIGLPGDNLASFEESVDFMLRRGLQVHLFQGSVLPGTGWMQTIEEDGTVFSPVPPRAILCNETFSLNEMLLARRIGHGVDFFNRFPRAAEIIWRHSYQRPVDLCRAIGEEIERKYGTIYEENRWNDRTLPQREKRLLELVPDLCHGIANSGALLDLVAFEAAYSHMSIEAFGGRAPRILQRNLEWSPKGKAWLKEHPYFRSDACERLRLSYRIDQFIRDWELHGKMPSLESIPQSPITVLFYYNRNPRFMGIEISITDSLLQRFNGFFSVEECLDNIDSGWRQVGDLSALWEQLDYIAVNGIIEPGENGSRS